MENQEEHQGQDRPAEETDDTQNDLAGNASGNGPDSQNDSLPSDGPVSQEEGDDGEDLTNMETDDDDELEITD